MRVRRKEGAGKKSGKWRDGDGEGMGIRPLKCGRKDVPWNYLCFLNPLHSPPSMLERGWGWGGGATMYFTYVPSLSDADFVCASADV